jgi:hypothetical protein
MWAYYILRSMLDNRSIPMELPTQYHVHFVTWEISVLFLFVGGVLGGVNTKNGPKQGVLVGLCASALLFGLHLRGDLREVPQTILLKYFFHVNFADLGETWAMVVLTLISVVPVGLLGGWFGSQLLPPLIRPPRPAKRGFSAPP